MITRSKYAIGRIARRIMALGDPGSLVAISAIAWIAGAIVASALVALSAPAIVIAIVGSLIAAVAAVATVTWIVIAVEWSWIAEMANNAEDLEHDDDHEYANF